MEPDIPGSASEFTGIPGAIERWLRGNWGWMVAAVAVVAAIIGGIGFFRWQQMSLFQDSEVLARLFGLLGLWAARLKVRWRPSETPLERAAAFNKRLPEAAPAVDAIADLFVAQQYGRQQPAPDAINGLARLWQQLQPHLWKRWLIDQFR
jgi:hypothetical protein